MKKQPDEIDFEILKNAIRLCPPGKNEGARMREVYRPLLNERCDSFLWKRVTILAQEGYLKLERMAGKHVVVRPTPKARRLLEHNGPKDGEQ